MLGGSILAYSGLKGHNISAVIRNLIAGKDPSSLPVTGAIGIVNSGNSGSTTTSAFTGGSSSGIVDDAKKYIGVPYNWGHANPSSGWDCSGFLNWVLGHDLGMTLPLGVKGFTGSWHGPVAANYFVWTALTSIPRNQAAAGDLACWPTHIGIVSGNNSMVNAYSRGRPTAETPIDGWGPSGEPLRIRRFSSSPSGIISV